MRKLLVIIVVVALAIGVAGIGIVAAADDVIQPFGWMGRGIRAQNNDDWNEPPMLARGLDLTPEQAEELEALHDGHYEQMTVLRDQLWDLREAYREAISEGDQAVAAELSEQSAAIREEMFNLRDENRDEVYSVLTPEQQEELDTYRNENCPMGGLGPQGRQGYGMQGGFGHHGGGRGMHGSFGNGNWGPQGK